MTEDLEDLLATKAIVLTQFQEKVYSLVKQIPRGKVSTYGALAKELHSCARAVGGAMRRNPFSCDLMP
jgi:methylated-DNA-[protein]-cysteine S-methyltransferase